MSFLYTKEAVLGLATGMGRVRNGPLDGHRIGKEWGGHGRGHVQWGVA